MTDQEKAFIESCFKGDLKGIKTCIDYNVDIHVENDWCIDIVSRNGKSEIVKFFINIGISDKSAAKHYVLAYAANYNDIELVKFLIRNSEEYKIDSASIQWAAAKGHNEVLELLLPYIDNLDSAYCNAAKHGHIETLRLFNDNNIFEFDRNIDRTLNCAAMKDKWHIIEFLLSENIVSYETLAQNHQQKYQEWLYRMEKL